MGTSLASLLPRLAISRTMYKHTLLVVFAVAMAAASASERAYGYNYDYNGIDSHGYQMPANYYGGHADLAYAPYHNDAGGHHLGKRSPVGLLFAPKIAKLSALKTLKLYKLIGR